jgi:hypothetical protein
MRGGTMTERISQLREALDKMLDDVMRAKSLFLAQQIVGTSLQDGEISDGLDAVQARLAAPESHWAAMAVRERERRETVEARLTACEQERDDLARERGQILRSDDQLTRAFKAQSESLAKAEEALRYIVDAPDLQSAGLRAETYFAETPE